MRNKTPVRSPRRLWSDNFIDSMLDEISRLEKCVSSLIAAGDGITGAMPTGKDWRDARTAWDRAKSACERIGRNAGGQDKTNACSVNIRFMNKMRKQAKLPSFADVVMATECHAKERTTESLSLLKIILARHQILIGPNQELRGGARQSDVVKQEEETHA